MADNISKIQTGIDTSDATAISSDILSNKTAYVKGNKITGTMTNRGAVSQSLGVNETYVIPSGYHNGSGRVTQSITTRGSSTSAMNVAGNNPMKVRIPQGAYFTNASSGYPEISVPLSSMRGAGMALQSELTSMTTDRDNWRNTAQNRLDRFNFSNNKNLTISAPDNQTKQYIYIFVIQKSYLNNLFIKASLLSTQFHLVEVFSFYSSENRSIDSGYSDTKRFDPHGFKFRLTPNFSNRTFNINLIQDTKAQFRSYAYISEYDLYYSMNSVLNYKGM